MDSPTDITKLKVIDLKKMLKERGLTVTGTKAELIARLQEIEHDTNDAIDGSGDHIEDELLGEDDEEVEDEEVEAQPVTTTLETPTVEKVAEPEDGEKKTERVKITAPGEAAKKSPEQSEEEKVAQRAKRFGGFTSEEAQKLARSQRFGLPVTAKASTPTDKAAGDKPAGNITKTAVMPEDLEKIKKRAERFGTVTSTTLSQTEGVEKLKKRADRFGEITSKTVAKADETDKQLKRKQRFGTTISGPGTGTVSSSTEVEEKKKKRAERFKITA